MFIKTLNQKFFIVLLLFSYFLHLSVFSQSVWIPFKEKEFWGIKDDRGLVIFNPQFDSVFLDHQLYKYFDNQIVIIKNGKYGVVNLKGNFTVLPSYDMIFVNGGMDLENNSTETIATASGFFTVGYNRISEYVSETTGPLSQYELYFIILKTDNKYLILNKKFLPLLTDPVDDVFINPEIYCDYGIMILKDHDRSAILYQYGQKITGFIYNSIAFLLNEEPYLYHAKTFKIVIDGEIVRFSKNGRITDSEACLLIPEFEFYLKGKRDTRSWIFDFTMNKENIYISDGESNLYCFSDDRECQWIREVPDLFHYKPVITDRYLAAGNTIFNLDADSLKVIPVKGKNIRCVQIAGEYLLYISDFDDKHIPEQTEISGWYDIIESAGPSSARLICYDLKKEAIQWNRPLPVSSLQDLQVYKTEHIVLSLSISQPLPETFVFLLNMEDGSETGRQIFANPQRIITTDNDIFISDFCDPDYDPNCKNLVLRILNHKRTGYSGLKMKIDYPENLYISNDFIFYLGNDLELDIRNIKSWKKKKSISLKWLDNYSDNPVKETRMLQFTGEKLYFLTADQYLFSIDPRTSEIKSYGFYASDRWIKITEKVPVISGNKALVMDEYGDLYIFKLF